MCVTLRRCALATAKKVRPRNKALNETLMARSRGGGSGAHKNSSEKREKAKLDREVSEQLKVDAFYGPVEPD